VSMRNVPAESGKVRASVEYGRALLSRLVNHAGRCGFMALMSIPLPRRQRACASDFETRSLLLERWAAMQPWDEALEQCFIRVASKVGHLKHTNAGEAHRLQVRLAHLKEPRRAYLAAKARIPAS